MTDVVRRFAQPVRRGPKDPRGCGVVADTRAATLESDGRAIGEGTQPELIAVTTPAHAPLVLVEGHVRLTASALFPGCLLPATEILLGVSEQMTRWWAF